MNATDIENKLKHTVQWSLDEIHSVARQVVNGVEAEWPTIQHLVTSGELVEYLHKLIALVVPVLDYAKTAFPQHTATIEWLESLLEDIEKVSKLLPTT